MREATPTRNTALELGDERKLMRQGHEFLDEKRMLLAAETLRQLRIYQQFSETFETELKIALETLAAAVQRHGLDNLQIYPAPPGPDVIPASDGKTFLGIPLIDVRLSAETADTPLKTLDPSPEAGACRAAFDRLLRAAANMGARASNLHRLEREYRRTERRAKALENVLLPEVEEAIKRVYEQLEALDREEAIRARWGGTMKSLDRSVARPVESTTISSSQWTSTH